MEDTVQQPLLANLHHLTRNGGACIHGWKLIVRPSLLTWSAEAHAVPLAQAAVVVQCRRDEATEQVEVFLVDEIREGTPTCRYLQQSSREQQREMSSLPLVKLNESTGLVSTRESSEAYSKDTKQSQQTEAPAWGVQAHSHV